MDYKRIYDELITRGKNRIPDGYVERHHIVPRCMGGTDDLNNMVALTAEEHYLAHLLLVKIYPEEPKLLFAVHRMTYGTQGKLKGRKLYGWLRRKCSKAIGDINSLSQSGKGNSQYGRFWIYNTNTLESTRIDNETTIPDGWQKGRIQNKQNRLNKLKEQKEKKKQKIDHAYYWYNKLLNSDAKSIREFVKNSDYDKSHVAFIAMLKRYVKEFDPQHGKPFRDAPNW